MEPDTVNFEQAIQGFTVMSAIPVVLLGLWGDYFGRRIEQLEIDTPDFEREVELEKVKTAGLCALVSQLFLFLGAYELREQYPAVLPLIFMTAILCQMFIQAKTENKVQKISPKRENILGISLRATLCWVIGVLLHIFFLGLSAGIAAVLIQKFQPSFFVGILALAGSGVLGLVAGIFINLGLAPFYFKQILPMRKLEEGALRTRMESYFTRFGVVAPELWIIELEELKITHNILMGLQGKSGIFQLSFFLSSLVLSTLSENELEALTLNQVSHFVLKHPKKRGKLIFTLIVITTFLALISMTTSQGLAVHEPLGEVVVTLISFIVFLGSFRILFLQTQKHVTEGDLYTVERMGISCEVLTRTLRKLDLLADPIPLDYSAISKVPVGFPETERRIKLLESSTAVGSKENLDKVA